MSNRLNNQYDGRPCPRCLTRSKRGAHYCRNCGKRLPSSSPLATLALALAVAGIISIFWLRASRSASPMAATIAPFPSVMVANNEIPSEERTRIQCSAKLGRGELYLDVYNGSNWAVDSVMIEVTARPRAPSRNVQTYELSGTRIRPMSAGLFSTRVAFLEPTDDWTYRIVSIGGVRVR